MIDTRQLAHERIAPHAPNLRDRIHSFLRAFGSATRETIARELGIRLQTVCARVAELKAEGRVRETGKREATSSGSPAGLLRAVSEQERKQGELF